MLFFPPSRARTVRLPGRLLFKREQNHPYRAFGLPATPADNAFHSDIIPQFSEKYQHKSAKILPNIDFFFCQTCLRVRISTCATAKIRKAPGTRPDANILYAFFPICTAPRRKKTFAVHFRNKKPLRLGRSAAHPANAYGCFRQDLTGFTPKDRTGPNLHRGLNSIPSSPPKVKGLRPLFAKPSARFSR